MKCICLNIAFITSNLMSSRKFLNLYKINKGAIKVLEAQIVESFYASAAFDIENSIRDNGWNLIRNKKTCGRVVVWCETIMSEYKHHYHSCINRKEYCTYLHIVFKWNVIYFKIYFWIEKLNNKLIVKWFNTCILLI